MGVPIFHSLYLQRTLAEEVNRNKEKGRDHSTSVGGLRLKAAVSAHILRAAFATTGQKDATQLRGRHLGTGTRTNATGSQIGIGTTSPG